MASSAAPAQPFEPGRYNYRINGTVESLLTSDDATFYAFADKVRDDLNWLTDTRIITDRSALRGVLSVRLTMEILSGHEDTSALFTLSQIRDLEDKSDAKQTADTEIEALLKARQRTGLEDGPDVAYAYGKILRADLESLPPPVAAKVVKDVKLRAELGSPAAVVGLLGATIDPSVAQTHTLTAFQAWELISARVTLKYIMPLHDETEKALAGFPVDEGPPPADIWAPREVTLTAADRLTPVVVAIWDSGVDLSQFPGQVYTDPAAGADPHGLAFDLEDFPSHGELMPLTADQAARYPDFAKGLKGYSELEAGLSTADVDALKARLKSLTGPQFASMLETFSLYESYSHGTHVAGIAARGNPAVRLAVGRITSDWRTIPDAPSVADAERVAQNYQNFVRWFRDHGVRVVNMSWEEKQGLIMSGLDKNGVGKTMQARYQLSKQIFDIESAGLKRAMASAPDVLFICAAGNDGLDTKSVKGIPASLDLPNLLTVGAVDQAGAETSFTNYGDVVKVDADGYQVDSNLPGGFSAKMSGTSMASPNVVNLAAKLIALDPSLTPPQVIRLIEDGAKASADGRLHNIDPKRSVDMLRTRLSPTPAKVPAAAKS
jgi:subtilisin family serine protease